MKFKDNLFQKPQKDQSNEPSRHLYIAGVGDLFDTNLEMLKNFFSGFGELEKTENYDGVYMPPGKRFSFVSYVNLSDSIAAYSYFQRDHVEWPDLQSIKFSKLHVKYAFPFSKDSGKPEAECTSVTADVHVPGLAVVEDFITFSEEEALLKEFDMSSEGWKETLSRRVQVQWVFYLLKTLSFYARLALWVLFQLSNSNDRLLEADAAYP